MVWKVLNTLQIDNVPEAREAFHGVSEIHTLPADRDKVLACIGDYDSYMAAVEIRVDEEFLSRADNLKLIGSPHTGQDHLDLACIKSRGIELFTISKEYELLSGFTATSELAFALLLSLIRRLPQARESANNGVWSRETYTGFQLYNKTMGILGLGRLGKISARIAQGFGMNVLAHDIVDQEVDGVEMVSFDSLFSRSDIVSVHIHLDDTTRGLVGKKAIDLMKQGAIILNTSRGAIIDEPALLDGLSSGHLGGAGLDVIDGEWLTTNELASHPLIAYARSHDNLIVVPHIGGATTESINGARIFMAQKMSNWIKDQG
jgi:D-3-phosphoglycerate dehydrogenase / 2-oxoglutarate reductase